MRIAVVVGLACAAVLSAAAVAQPVSVELQAQVKPGEHPALVVGSEAAIARVRVELMRDDGKKIVLDHGAVAAGQKARLDLPLPPGGRAMYEGSVVASFAGGKTATVPLHFDTAAAAAMKIGYARERLDLDAHRLSFTLSQPAARAELRVIADDGNELATAREDFHGERPGTWLTIGWSPSRSANVLALELRATSTSGATAGVRLVPWSVRIPHEEVVFASGNADIRASEEAKLDASFQRITAAVDKARAAEPSLPVKLYIAGHTDTVGTNAANQQLSLARARAIAGWFRGHGMPLPIAYAGFGESALKVKTPDETDNEANRRADYIVGVEEPEVARGIRATWYKLQ
jgi:outer membrane protein OmpA-like peptidoglycan-associated protein